MAQDLLMSIARENFGRTKYIPVLHGRSESVQPTALILKQNRPWWKKPFHHSELKILSKLEKYVVDVYQKGFREKAESSVIRIEKRLQKKEIAEVKQKHELTLKATEGVSLECTSNCNLGDLELGMMDEEYYEDTDLREILQSGLLCKDKMEPYLKHKLYIVTSVVYSSMFRIVGKRESSFDLSGRVNLKTKFGGWVGKIGSVGGRCSSINCKSAMVTRKKKAPIFFTVCPVKYDESTGKLRISENHFVGNVVARGLTHVKLQKREDSFEDLLNVIEDSEDGEFGTESELFNIPDLETKLEAIKKLLLSTDSREERENLIVKYLYMVSKDYAMSNDGL
ncbi:hypothetical protein AC249_AIPGENE8653 [Exaiptasia diaphana]|nr:hypothetical protein AC249_AIPGENE8653 [Exaiptasia diaphana]